MKPTTNYQDFLKVIAIIVMIIDHVGLYFFPEQEMMRLIGRSAMPIFCFFAGYNFKAKPNLKVLLYGLLLYLTNIIVHWQFLTTNILISIFLGQCYLCLFQNQLKGFYSSYCHVIVLCLLWPFTWFLVDYGSLVIALMVLGYTAKQDKINSKLTVLISVILSVYHTLATFYAVFNFSKIDVLIVLGIAAGLYLLMTIKDFAKPIPINLKPISRNVMFIYFAQFIVIQLAWLYYLYHSIS